MNCLFFANTATHITITSPEEQKVTQHKKFTAIFWPL